MNLEKLISQYQKKVKKAAFDQFSAASAKQQLVSLTVAKLLTPLQQRTIARRMDQLVASDGGGQFKALEQAVEELFTGKLKVGVKRDPKSKAGALKLSELREKKPGLSRKQTLLELRNAGVLSPQQTRDAAKHITAGMTVEQALIKVEAPHLLDELPPEPETEQEVEPAATIEEGEPEDEDDDDQEEEPAPADPDAKEKPRTLADVVAGSVKELKADLEKIKSGPAVKQLLLLELTGKQRKSAVEAIREKGEDLGLSDDDFAQAIQIHNDTVKGTPVEDAYPLGNVPEE